MKPEARPLEFTNGRAHFYRKKKVDSDSQQMNPRERMLCYWQLSNT